MKRRATGQMYGDETEHVSRMIVRVIRSVIRSPSSRTRPHFGGTDPVRAGRSTGSTMDLPVAVCIFSADDPLVAESPPAPSSNRSAYHQRTFARIVGPRVGQTTDSSVRHRRVRPQPTAERGRLRTYCTSGAPNPALRCAENARPLCRKRTDASRPHSCM